jgi:hypothetical protein
MYLFNDQPTEVLMQAQASQMITIDQDRLIHRQMVEQLGAFVKEQDQLFYLKNRWLDEREYEDFAEYKKVIEDIFTKNGYKVQHIGQSFTIKVLKDMHLFEVKINASNFKIRSI